MKNSTNFYVNWLIVSKHAMDRQDYRILAGSIDDPEPWRLRFKHWIKDEVPLEANSASPGAPYYYFIPEKIDGILNQIIIRQTWADYGDFASRRVLNTTCLVLPYDAFQEHPCGFKQQASLFALPEVDKLLSNTQQAIRNGETLFSQPSPEITLPDSSEVEDYFLAQLSEHGLDFSQAIGTYLTKGKNVCIWERNDKISYLEQRLEWLDAALIALPYGVRANCSAASWQSTYTETGDCLVIGRKSNPNLAYFSPDEQVEETRLCEGYAAGIRRLLDSGHSAEELLRTFLTLTIPIDLNVLRYGPKAILHLSPQEQVDQLLVNPEEYDTETNQRVLIEKIKNIDRSEVNVKDLQTLLVRTVPGLEDSDASLIKDYWSDALLTQAIVNFKAGNNKILNLLPLIIPDQLREEKLRDTLDEIWDHATTKEASCLDELTRFFESLHRFCTNRAQVNNPQLTQAINSVLNKISSSGNTGHIAALIWIRFILSPGTNYQNGFFEVLSQQKNLQEPLSIFSSFWQEQSIGQTQINDLLLHNLLLSLTKISFIRSSGEQESKFLQILLKKLISQNSRISNGSKLDLRLIGPLLTHDYWADYPQEGKVAALLDEICFLVQKQWGVISTLKEGNQNIDSYQAELSRFYKKDALNIQIGKVDRDAILDTYRSLDQTKSLIKSQEAQILIQDPSLGEDSQLSADSKPDYEQGFTPLPTETGDQEMEQYLPEEDSPSANFQPTDVHDDTKDVAKPEMETVTPQLNNMDTSTTEMPSDLSQDDTIQILQDIHHLAQSTAKQIEEGRSHGDSTIWAKITAEIQDNYPLFSSQELEQLLLLTLGSIQDGNIRKETLKFFLPVLYKNYPTLADPASRDQFFQSHSEFVADVLGSYYTTFTNNPKFDEWIKHLSGLLQSPQNPQ